MSCTSLNRSDIHSRHYLQSRESVPETVRRETGEIIFFDKLFNPKIYNVQIDGVHISANPMQKQKLRYIAIYRSFFWGE